MFVIDVSYWEKAPKQEFYSDIFSTSNFSSLFS